MPRPSQDLEVRHALRRERLVVRLATVVEALLGGGVPYSEVRVEDVIRAAGMARSTFYRYFDGTTDLLLALGDTAVREVVAAADVALGPPGAGTREDLAERISSAVDVFERHLTLLGAMVAVGGTEPEVGARLTASFDEAQERIATRIAAGQAAGFVRPELDPSATAGWLTWMTERGMHQLVARADPGRRPVLERALVDVIWFTLYAR